MRIWIVSFCLLSNSVSLMPGRERFQAEFDEVVENHSRQEILSLLGEAEPPKKLCAELMDFIDAHEDLKKYWEEHINVDCRKKAE